MKEFSCRKEDGCVRAVIWFFVLLHVTAAPSAMGSGPPEDLARDSSALRVVSSSVPGEGVPTEGIALQSLAQLHTQTEKEAEDPSQGPYFMVPPTTHVTTRAGQTANLTCIVRQLGDRQVSWIRGRDLHVLSSGLVTFSSDSRISVSSVGDSWKLTVRYAQPSDAGSYACQVNTQPRMATWLNLTVVEARATILGKKALYVQSGSTVVLECVIREELLIPGLVLWYHDDRLVARESSRIHVATSVGTMTTSRLSVASAETNDSGNYSCWPSAGRPDSVVVHVIQGDPPAAMHHGNSASGLSAALLFLFSLLALLFLLA